jgi:hypothetical protein
MNFLARVITKRSIEEVLKVIETYFLGPTNDLIFGSISPLVLGGVGIPTLDRGGTRVSMYPSRPPLPLPDTPAALTEGGYVGST